MKQIIYSLIILFALASCQKDNNDYSVEIRPSKDVTELTVYMLGYVHRLGYVDIVEMTKSVRHNNKEIPFKKGKYSIFIPINSIDTSNAEGTLFFISKSDTIAHAPMNSQNEPLQFHNYKRE